MVMTGCQPASHRLSSERDVHVLSISPVEIDETASALEGAPEICQNWSLTEDQAEKFFLSSTRLDARTYYHEYDTAPCKLTGIVNTEGKTWKFVINGAAKAVLVSDGDTQYLGCSTPSCEPLVMWLRWQDNE